MFYKITFSNSDTVAESEDGKVWYMRNGYITYQLPTDSGCVTIEDELFLRGYEIKSISVVVGENTFSFKVAKSPRRWEVIKSEGGVRSIVGYIYETGEPGSAYRFEPADTKKEKEVRSNSLVRLLTRLKPRNWK